MYLILGHKIGPFLSVLILNISIKIEQIKKV